MNDTTITLNRRELAKTFIEEAIARNSKGEHDKVGMILKELRDLVNGEGLYKSSEGDEG